MQVVQKTVKFLTNLVWNVCVGLLSVLLLVLAYMNAAEKLAHGIFPFSTNYL